MTDIQVQLYFARRAVGSFGYTFAPLAILAASLPADMFLGSGALLLGVTLAAGAAYFRTDSVALARVPAYLRPRVVNAIRMRFQFLNYLGGIDKAASYLRDIDNILDQFWKAVDAVPRVSDQTLQKMLGEIDEMFRMLSDRARTEAQAHDDTYYKAVLQAKESAVRDLRTDNAAEKEVDQMLNQGHQ